MNIFRKLLIAALENNCGYTSGGRHSDSYALAWNVKVYKADASIEAVTAKLAEENPRQARLVPYLIDAKVLDWHESSEYENALDSARQDIDGSAKGTSYGSVSPATCARFGLRYFRHLPLKDRYAPITSNLGGYYPAKKAGWRIVSPYTDEMEMEMEMDVSYTFCGRSGGYIAMTEFEGRGLRMSTDQLIEVLRDDGETEHDGYYNKWCQRLCAMIYECDRMFTTQNAAAEIMYQLAWRLGREVEEWQEERSKFKAERRERRYWESRDVVTA